MHLEVADFGYRVLLMLGTLRPKWWLLQKRNGGVANPQLLGAHKHFSATKKKFFDRPADERAKMTSSADFNEFLTQLLLTMP